jgi:hypothetical protein
MKIVKTFIASNGVAMDIDLGFVPDTIHAFADCAGTGPIEYWWDKGVYNAVLHSGWTATRGRYGFTRTQAAGVATFCSSAAYGFIPYDTEVDGVKVPSPTGKSTTTPDGLVNVPAGAAAAAAATISDWLPSVNYASGGQDRSASVAGTCIRPLAHNGRIFELVTGYSATGSTYDAASVWDVAVGEQVTDVNGNIWICREEVHCKIGCKGIEIGASIAVNGAEWVLIAETVGDVKDGGDGDLNNPI